ncbi:MAG: substrate-binding domain-containing protein, partial [bacterium]|nr:substrate-binding domain-containing protein [bacterium]
ANKVNNLTTGQVRDIFNGKITNWREVGGSDKLITVVSREAGSGTRTSFEQIITGIDLTGNALIQNSNGTIQETVANDKHSIGYMSHGLVSQKVKALKLDGADCTTEAINAGKYALVRPIFLLVKGEPAPGVKAFIDYVLSPEGQKTIESDGLLPAK